MVTSTLDPLRQLNSLLKPLRGDELVSVSRAQLCAWRDEIARLKEFEPKKLPFPINLFTKYKRSIVECVHKAGKRGATYETLYDCLWGADPNGGPAWARNALSVHICFANRKLAEHGLVIRNRGKHAGGAYVLEELK